MRVLTGPQFHRVALPVLLLAASGASAATNFIAGADCSHLSFFESRGVVYRDGGQVRDALVMLKQHGLTCIRLRLFTSSPTQAQADPYNYGNNLTYTLPLAVRVKAAGLKFMLDFHYSDTWADPAHQRKPVLWTNLDFPQLVQQMRAYNSNCLAAFQAAGALPDYVQIGNEITGGLLWPEGQVGGAFDTPVQWSQLGQLLKAAVQGIRDACMTQVPQIIVHIDRGGDWAGTQWFFDKLARESVPFDALGESYYPFWHGTLADLSFCVTNAARRYGKPVIVAETAFPWNNSRWTNNLGGLPASSSGQTQYVASLASWLKLAPASPCGGIVWWGTEYQKVSGVNSAGFDSTSFFDAAGNLLPVADSFGQLSAAPRLRADRSGSTLVLNWPLSGAGAVMASSTNVPPLALWLPVTNPIEVLGTGCRLAVPVVPVAPDPHVFYKLQWE